VTGRQYHAGVEHGGIDAGAQGAQTATRGGSAVVVANGHFLRRLVPCAGSLSLAVSSLD
jgi:hypothetical protein